MNASANQPTRSFGRNGADLRLLAHLGSHPGTFVEAGAHNGITESNTLLLERSYGWRGLLIEPIPDLAAECRHNRPHALVEQSALVSSQHAAQSVIMTYSSGLSVVHGTWGSEARDRAWAAAGARLYPGITPYDIEVPARTLSSVLDQYSLHDLDLLSLDVEGAEAHVLSGLDFERHAPRFVFVEVWEENADEVAALLEPHYKRTAELGHGEVGHHRQAEVLYVRRVT
jgi:FkbM family methyltransferase